MNRPTAPRVGSQPTARNAIAPRPRPSHLTRALSKKVQAGAYWVLGLGVLHLLLGGLLLAFGLRAGFPATVRGEPAPPEWAQWLTVAEALTLGVVYVAMYRWAKRSPVPALRTALALYVGTYLLTGALEPAELFRGIIWKGLVGVVIARALLSAEAMRKRAQNRSSTDLEADASAG